MYAGPSLNEIVAMLRNFPLKFVVEKSKSKKREIKILLNGKKNRKIVCFTFSHL